MESEWHKMDVQHIQHLWWARNNFLYKMFELIVAKEKNICGLREKLPSTFSIRKFKRYLESQKQAASLTQRKAKGIDQRPKTREVVWQLIISRTHSACLRTCKKRQNVKVREKSKRNSDHLEASNNWQYLKMENAKNTRVIQLVKEIES